MAVHLNIVTPRAQVVDADVDSVVAPGAEGEFGVLEGHEAFLAPLKPGVVQAKGSAGDRLIAISNGFAEVRGERVTLLVNSAELPEQIDRERAEAARSRAQARLSGRVEEAQTDRGRAESALARAEARISALLG
jgi:F-type H+-transporting ATPase subunit epsilon